MGFKVVVDFDKWREQRVVHGLSPRRCSRVRDDDFLYVLQEEPPDSLRPQCEEAARVLPQASDHDRRHVSE